VTDLYEILGIDPRATTEQVDRAYRFSLEMYGEAALATYSLLGPHELAEMRARIEVAYRVLKDPVRRQHYDESSGGTPASLPLPFPAPQSTPSVPEPTPSVSPLSPVPGRQEVLPEPVTGADLRRFREERGIRLQDIASASKIGSWTTSRGSGSPSCLPMSTSGASSTSTRRPWASSPGEPPILT
jgi:curved DNA-binding protein CbpA